MHWLLILSLFLLGYGFSKDVITVSTYPLYYATRWIAGDRFEVDLLIRSQADPHHYELRPADMRRLTQSKAFLYLGVEAWERKLSKSIKIPSYALSEGLELLRVGAYIDPHVWMSPKSYGALVESITKTLANIDPKGKNYYMAKKEEFIRSLRELDGEYAKVLKSCRHRIIVTTHMSLNYLGRDYGLEVVGLRGMHAEEEPRPSEVRAMVERLKKTGVKSIFHEVGHDRSMAEGIARQVKAKIFPLNTSLFPEDPKDDYFSIMRRNLRSLSQGLDCQ
ncbi:MAG: zinc ABC transporter substrate-binding protein [Acidobacteria bacterium]|jgi:zinc transport system substrate-binding protein|nr:MAG: zinc ABC transporter substrate-binding protein [Acidobacteriota bacterium]